MRDETLRRSLEVGAFAIERVQRAGTPFLWDERITVSSAGLQSYSSTRSSVDEGGVPVGFWSGKTDREALQAIARALITTSPWELASESILPGQEYVEWRITTDGGAVALTVAGGSPTLFRLASLDSELRAVASDLVEAHSGAELRCEMDLEHQPHQTEARVRLRNDGDTECLIRNPFTSPNSENDYIRVETARVPEELPGVTSVMGGYTPLPSPFAGAFAPPWTDDFILLGARSTLVTPIRVVLPPRAAERIFVRAVYSCYPEQFEHLRRAILRGRAFSVEMEW